MKQKKITDEEIADGIILEVEMLMKRIEDSHNTAEAAKGPLKSDFYTQMKHNDIWDAKRIVQEYVLITRKGSQYPSNIRRYIKEIFKMASTNFWAKRIYDKNNPKTKKK